MSFERLHVYERCTMTCKARLGELLLQRGSCASPLRSSVFFLVASCRVTTMTLVGNLDDDLQFGGICAASVGSQGSCVCPHVQRGGLYNFWLISR
jgi:hypothetical protein